IFFVDLPTKSVREEILKIHLRKKHRDPDQFDVSSLAEDSVGFSGAELEEAVREGLYDAFAEGNALKTEDIARALKKTYPLSSTMRDQLEDLRRWAKIRARLASDSDPEPLPPESGGRAPTLQQERARNPFVPRERA
ncbi:MAG: hypothetical protein KC468_28790, partial [Myxococcales bacterium]|nr:hypothetical protein [Myxococcales bacterium]